MIPEKATSPHLLGTARVLDPRVEPRQGREADPVPERRWHLGREDLPRHRPRGGLERFGLHVPGWPQRRCV